MTGSLVFCMLGVGLGGEGDGKFTRIYLPEMSLLSKLMMSINIIAFSGCPGNY